MRPTTAKQADGFTLTQSQVPAPPDSTLWVDQLRWAIAVIDGRQTARIRFLAGSLAYALSNGGKISNKQANVCDDILAKIQADYDVGALACQAIPDSLDAPDDDAR